MMVVTLLTFAMTAIAQVTTSGINGIVTTGDEEAIGATITAKHIPSGSVYRAVTNIDFTDIQLALGQNTVIDAKLSEEGELLQEVVVVAAARNTMRSDRSGAVTNLNADQMAAIPTVGRSMTDLMKMTPQSSSASGMAIGGGNYRQSTA